MAFIAVLVRNILRLIILGAVAFGGVGLGRYLRKKKDEKDEK